MDKEGEYKNTPVVLRGIKEKDEKEEKMKRALIVTTVSGFVPQFEMNNVKILQQMGYQVHYASNFYHPHYGTNNHRLEGTGIICHQIDFVRSPFRIWKNLKAYWQLQILFQKNEFDLVHCHTPMGGVLGRLAVESYRRKKRMVNKEMKLFYTVHGFHFFYGASFINWVVYYPVERWLAHYTDVLITINQEDYGQAKSFRLRQGGKVWKVNGVGINNKFYLSEIVDKNKKRAELGVTEEEFVLLSVGELTKRKNHRIVLETLAMMPEECKQYKIRYFICGEGAERKNLNRMIQKYGLNQIVTLLGYRSDVRELLKITNCFIFPSKQEGLPAAMMEAMAAGVVCICSDIRGNRELVEKSISSIAVKRNNKYLYRAALKRILETEEKQKNVKERLDKKYQQISVIKKMEEIYKTMLCD